MTDLSARSPDLSPEQKRALLARLLRERRLQPRRFPLSAAQQRFWFLDQLDPGTPAYNIPAAVRLVGHLDVAAFDAALQEIVHRHGTLRSVFPAEDGQPVQVVSPALRLPLPVVDLQGLPAVERERELRLRARQEVLRPFDLTAGPLLRVTLLRLAAGEYVALLTLHHMVCDGWSLGVLVREIAALYEAFTRREPSPLPELPIQYTDFVAWQRKWLEDGGGQEQLSYWRRQLAGELPALELPADRLRPPRPSDRGSVLPAGLSAPLVEALGRLAEREGATPFMALLAGFVSLLHRYTGQKDVLVGSPIANRRHREAEGLIGVFVNTLVLRVDLSGDPAFRALVSRVRETALGAYTHQDVPFELLMDELRAGTGGQPPFRVMFVLQNVFFGEVHLPDLTLLPYELDVRAETFDLTLALTEWQGRLGGTLTYSRDLFDEDRMERLLRHFETLLAGAVEQPDLPVSELPLLTPVERRQLELWSGDREAIPDLWVHEMFELQVARTPDAPAVVDGEATLTYRELDQRSARLARRLIALGTRPDDRVGICLERSMAMVVSLLAVLRAGAAYVPLDPAYPPDRLAYMVEASGMRLILTQPELEGTLPPTDAERIFPGGAEEDWSPVGEEEPLPRVDGESLVFVIFTSGSTGRPKGVAMGHRAMANLILWHRHIPGFLRRTRTLQFSSLSFDASFHEMFTTYAAGGTLVLLTEAQRRDPHALSAVMAEREVERIFMPSVFLQQVAEVAVLDGLWPSSLREVVSAGEQLRVTPAVATLARELPGFILHNHYGPTETHVVTAHALTGPPDRWPALPPIGRPIVNARVLVLDRRLEPVPLGVPGELYLGGVALARGYLGRPDLTAERFVPDPGGEPGSRLYKTGDLVRFLRTGDLEFLGRADDQVKIRGFRVELGEIEAVLGRLPGVRGTAVGVLENGGARRLVAWYVPDPERPAQPSDLRDLLAAKLPDYMVPATFVRLASLPVTPSGKVDRRALPRPESMPGTGASEEPALSPLEERLATLWRDLLGLTRVGRDDHFFALGGDSISTIQLVARARRSGLRLTVDQIFRHPTLAGLAAVVTSGAPQPAPTSRERSEGAERFPLAGLDPEALARLVERLPGLEDVYPLTPMQQGVLFHIRLQGAPGDYTGQLVTRLPGRLDETALRQAWAAAVARHPALRTCFVWEETEVPLQVVLRHAEPPFERHDLRGLEPVARRERIAAHIRAEQTVRPFDLARAPLLRIAVFTLADDLHEMVWSTHELAVDGWSAPLVLEDVRAAYEAILTGDSPEPAAAPAFRDYVAWLQEQDLVPAQEFWRGELRGFTAPTPLGGRTSGTPRAPRYGSWSVHLGAGRSADLRELARTVRVAPRVAVQAAWGLVLGSFAASEDVVFGGVISGRETGPAGVEGIVGLLLNTLPVRLRIEPSTPLSAWLQDFHARQLEARRHGHAPLSRIQRWSEVPPPARLFASILDVVSYFHDEEGEWSIRDCSQQRVGYPVLLLVRPGDDWELELTFDEEALDALTARRVLGHLEHLLAGMAAGAAVPVGDLPFLGPSERAQLLVEWNDSDAAVPAGVCAHQIFERLAAANPQVVAAVCQGESLTYGELNRRANRLARALVAEGAGPETVVALLAPRGLPFLTAILAVFKAGAAYLPLDPKHPAPRLLRTLRSSGAALVLAPDGVELPEGMPPEDRPRRLPIDSGKGAGGDLPPRAGTEGLAYVIYTSGSTGTPKGAMVVHAGMLNHLVAKVLDLGLTAADVVAQTASQTFDISVWQFLVPLVVGGRVAVIPDEIANDPRKLLEAVVEGGVTVLELVPSFLDLLREEIEQAGRPPLSALRWLVATGEALPPDLCRRWLEACPSIPLMNAYGPTECSDDVTHLPVRHAPAAETVHMPVGRPVANTRIYVLDPWHHPVPAGVPGEICVAGSGVGRGYLGEPARTAVAFVPSTSGEPGERMYRTGDLGRFLPDGRVEFLGRIDHQVKLRGVRIELGEIEAALERHPAVHQAAVLLREDSPGRKQLVAYVAPRARQGIDAAELRRALAGELPEPMLPAFFVLLEALPRMPSGKVDRGALPAPPDAAEAGSRPAVGERPSTPVEEILASIWSEILRLDRVGRRDDFFELGGHSLLATRLASAVRRTFRVELPLRTVFEVPTLAELARHIERLRTDGEAPLPPIERRPRQGPLPLSFAQQRLWFLDQLAPDSPAYNIPYGLWIEGLLEVPALAAAFAALVRRHESLRTVFVAEEGEPRQVVLSAAAPSIPVVDLESLPPDTREEAVRLLAVQEARRPFDLARGPLLRANLARVGPRRHALLLTLHHIVSDGWSTSVLIRDFTALYEAAVSGTPAALPDLPVQYPDYAVWQREWLRGEALEAQLRYWRERLAAAPAVLELPADRPRPVVPSGRGEIRSAFLPEHLTGSLAALCRRSGATRFMVLLAAWKALLHRLTDRTDLLVGSPVANRNRAEIEGLIGFFTNTLVLRTDLRPDGSAGLPFSDLLARVREVALGAYAHQDLPFEKLVEDLAPERRLSHAPLFQVLFVLQEAADRSVELSGLVLAPVPSSGGTAKFDLTLALGEAGGILFASLETSIDLFTAATAERMLGQFAALLEGALEGAEQTLGELPLLSPAERHQLLVEWNATAAAWPSGACVHELFEAWADREPERIALLAAGRAGTHGAWTYGEIERWANRLASRLRGAGVGPEVPVGVFLERGPEAVVTLLAVLKAGGCHLPLDPAYPAERIVFMLADARVPVIVAAAGAELPAGGARVIDPAASEPGDAERQRAQGLLADHPAYVIYTSGSTGRPKGVALPHRVLTNLVTWQAGTSEAPAGRTLQYASPSFDVSLQEVFATWGSGGALVVFPEELRRDFAGLLQLLRTAAVERLFLPFVALQQLAEAAAGAAPPESLREIVTAGEALQITPEIAALFERLTGCVLRNQYGPSETHVVSELAPLGGRRGSPESWPTLPPIGRPIANTSLFVLDRGFRQVPIGVPGEICLGGAGLARGYLGQPGLTAERFVPAPWGQGERLYRTGDLARFRPDGEIEFLGRIDHQVKIRGFRVEIAEIETVLASHPAVREAVVVPTGEGTARHLTAWVVPAGSDLPARDLRELLASRLPAYMIPSVFAAVTEIPLTPSGKADRLALARREPAPEPSTIAAAAPRTPVEEVLAGIWADVLGIERMGLQDDFFALGGHSLLATRVVSRVRSALAVELPVRDLFEHPTVEGLARTIEAAMRSDGSIPPLPPIVPVGREGDLPLSFAQQRLWFIDQLEPGSPAYNLSAAVRLEGSLDAATLTESLAAVVARHEVLRARFEAAGGEPVQRIAPAGGWDLPLVDLSGLPPSWREAEVREQAREEGVRQFDLARGPLLRGVLLRLGSGEHVALLSMHHIVSDGWSMGLLVRELAALYPALAAGQTSPLPPLPVQYADFAVWQRSWLCGEVLEAQIGWWRERLAGAPPALELPTDRPRPAQRSGRGAALPVRFSGDLTAGLTALARREGATLFMVLLAAWKSLLLRITGQDDLVVGTPIANRNRSEIESLIGFFVNTLALRSRLSPLDSFRDLTRQVREAMLGAYAHQDLPFERLVEELAPERELGRTPLFQVMLVLQNAPLGALELPGLALTPLATEASTAKLDLTLVLTENGDGLTGVLEYDRDLFDRATAARLAGWLERLAEGAVTDAEQLLGGLPLLSVPERCEVLEEWNRTATDYPRDATLLELFEAQVDRAPDTIAVCSGEASLSYRELDRQGNRLAHRLRALGVGPEVLVAVLAERSLETIAALLGILKAGGAYAPLNPADPAERLALLLEDLGTPVALAQTRFLNRLPAGRVRVLPLEEALAEGREDRPGVPVQPENLAYVLYTSGSTGRPKGVAVVHRAVVRLVREAGYAAFGPEEVWAQLAPLAFDASTLEIWGALLHGGRLALMPPGALSLAELGQELARQQVSSLWLTAGLFHQMIEENPEGLASVRQLLAGGDVLSPEHVRKALAVLPGCRLVNGYGPTENTTFTCCHPMSRPDEVGSPVPIGRPIANTRVYLLDQGLEPVPAGVAGELFAGGDGLARGYLSRPELTAERFVPDAWSGEPGGRLYRTGDRARRRADGRLEFLGRLDRQVKLRGFRVEPGEVEAALAEHPGVREAAVEVRSRGADLRLVAFVAGETSGEALRRHLEPRLPAWMVPSAFVMLEALPLTPNGKVDRRALAALDLAEEARSSGPAAARTPVEERLLELWSELLGHQDVGLHDDFFALGGHSLLATRLASRVRSLFGVDLPLRAIFESPTVASLAAGIGKRLAGERASAAPPLLPGPRSGPLPLSFSQQRLWFLDRLQPGGTVYNIPTALSLTGELDVAALQDSFTEIVRRHAALRTVFCEVDGEPRQVIVPPSPVPLPVVDLSGLPERSAEVRDREAARWIAEETGRPFDLEHGPLLRLLLLRRGLREHTLAVNVHHIASDGWSMGVLVDESTALYEAFTQGRPSPLPDLPIQYSDFALWQRRWLTGSVLDAQLAFWTRELAGAPALLELPTDHPRPALWSNRGATLAFTLPPAAAAAVRSLALSSGTTLFMVLLAAFQTLLHRWSGADDVLVGSPVAHRSRLEIERLIGFFVNTLVFRLRLREGDDVSTVLERVRAATLAGHDHEDLPFELLVDVLEVERSLAHNPLFQVMLALQNAPAGELRASGLTFAPVQSPWSETAFDLTLSLSEIGGSLSGSLEYACDLFDASTMARFLTHLRNLLEAMAADPCLPVGSILLMEEAELHQVLRDWNDTGQPRWTQAAELCVQELIAAQAGLRPGQPAVIGGSSGAEALTYGELDRQANRLARHLQTLGVGPGTCVGLLLERRPDLLVGLLGILKAGGAYVPLDPVSPRERIDFMLRDSAARVLVTGEPFSSTLTPPGGRLVCLDRDRTLLEELSGESVPCRSAPGDPAYVIYTSGTTGQPKGVVVSHRCLSSYAQAAAEEMGLGPADRALQFASISFDASAEEIFTCFLRGGTLVLRTEEMLASVADFLETCRSRGITVLNLPTAWWHLVAAEIARADLELPRNLRRIIIGGEAARSDRWAEWVGSVGAAVELVNLYGPTETTISASRSHLTRPRGGGPDLGNTRVPIGRPIPNVRLYVLDRLLQPVPIGVVGELYIAGPGVSAGYLGRAALTAERFLPDPYAEEPGARWYCTGDLVRFRGDGELEYIGRADRQVKIRGFRIELEEIEAALAQHPEVREAVVVVREDLPGDPLLAAYVVLPPKSGIQDPKSALRAFLSERLPDYMVPSAWAFLPALPLTLAGKLDRRGLPAPERTGAGAATTAPRTPEEELLAGVWAQLLGLPRVGIFDNFFALGGHSLLVTQLASRVRSLFGVELPLRAVFESPTVASLAADIGERLVGEQASKVPPLQPVPHSGPLPLSFAQQRLWFLDQLEPGNPVYNIPLAVRLRGALDEAALAASLEEIARRHEPLRTTFSTEAGEPVQVVAGAGPTLDRIDLTALPSGRREGEARRLADEDARQPFDLLRGPLFRPVLVLLVPQEHILLASMHHIVSDGWSMGVLVRELGALYTAFSARQPSPLPPLPVRYADYACWQREWLRGEALDALLGFWRTRLAGAPAVLDLPSDRPRPAARGGQGAIEPVPLPAGLAGSLAALARQANGTLYMTMLAAWEVLLQRSTGQSDLVVGTPIANRTRAEVEGLIGFFVNTLALRADLSGDPAFTELVGRVREDAISAYAHQDLPFERLVEELAPERSLAHTPLFQVMFVFQNTPSEALAVPGLEIAPMAGNSGTAKFDLTLTFAEAMGELSGSLTYSTELFDRATARRMAGHLVTLLAGIVAAPEARVSELPFLSAEERLQIAAWNDTGRTDEALRCVHELFAARVKETPEATAVVCEGASLSYRELDRQSDHLAGHLRELGAGPEETVGICLERSLDMVVAILAVFKAGAAYVPLDLGFPAARLAFVLDDARVRVLIAAGDPLGDLAPRGLVLVRPKEPFAARDASRRPGQSAGPGNLAYVIYTSGSTGRPKGVAVEHRQLSSYLAAVLARLALPAGASYAMVSTIAADLGNTMVFAALATGGVLHVISGSRLSDPEAMADYFSRHAVDCLKIVPSHLMALQASPAPEKVLPRSLLVLGGEAAPWSLVDAVRSMAPDLRVLNHYGPTETTVGVLTFETIAAGEEARVSSSVPLGRPLAGTRVWVLDRNLEPLPVGVPGELLVGGVNLTRGYLGRPDLTAEKFIPDPFGGEPGGRLYRTGDLTRRLPSGDLTFLGRIDLQVKIRGFRVEPGEVEEVLRRHPGVREAAVLARPAGGTGELGLVGYVVPRDAGALPTLPELRALVREALPEAAVPPAFVLLQALPLTPNGKVDRRTLAELPPADAVEAVREDFSAAPRNPVEELIAGFFCEVLGLARVGVDDDFFELGGHSLMATRLLSRMRAALLTDLELRSIFERRTVAGLAALVVEERRRELWAKAPPLVRQERGRAATLSFAQERLWFLDQLEGSSAVYNVPRVIAIEGPLRPAVLAAALDEVVRRHEALRTVFTAAEPAPLQVVQADWPLGLPVIELGALPAPRRHAEADRLAAEEARRPFDLAAGPLLRKTLLRLGPEEHRLLLDTHHIVSDAWSAGVLLHEVTALYEAFAAGRPSPLPELPLQYADFAIWQRSWISGEALAALLAAWRERLAGAPPALELPTDRPRPVVQTSRGASLPVRLDAVSAAALRDLSRGRGVTLFMTLLAAFQTLLHRLSGQNDLVVGSPVAGRNRQEIEGLIGIFINLLALRADLSGQPPFAQLLAQVRETALDAYALQDLPFEKLVEELQPVRDLSRTPLFQAVLVLQNAPLGPLALPGLSLTPLAADFETVKYDLTLSLAASEDGLTGALEINRDLFDATTAERLIRSFRTLVMAAAGRPDVPIAELPFLDDQEAHQLVVEWNDTRVACDLRCVHEMFSERARTAPDALAVTGPGGSLTYGELEAASNRLARCLRRSGVGPEVLVMVCFERSPALLTALLGVLKAGGAYVPVDPSYPVERLLFMVRDAGAPVVVTESRHRDLFALDRLETICLDTDLGQLEQESPAPLAVPVRPENLAYVIYTSGSTGRPKGVAVAHGSLRRLANWHHDTYGVAPADRAALVGAPAFDASVAEVWPCLTAGASLHVPPEELRMDPEALVAWLTQAEMTLSYLPTPLFEAVLQLGLPEESRLRYLTTGGDRLRRRPKAGLRCTFINHYGPTESTVATSYTAVEPGNPAVLPTIGRPVANLAVHLVDPRLQAVPIGVVGELCIGGEQLARGYLGRPGLTAGRFVPDPFSAVPGSRLYRSGDLARRLSDGQLDFIGRLDHQVKLRGFRIELGEIETLLGQHPDVGEVAVAVREDRGIARLAAYVVPAGPAAPEPEKLAGFLRRQLPEYMVPSLFLSLEQLPLTTHGKVDRAALARLAEPAAGTSRNLEAARDPLEEILGGIWASVLGLERVEPDANFFDLGGHSLLAAQVAARVRQAFEIELPLRAIFEAPTLAALTETVRGLTRAGQAAAKPPVVRVPRDRPLPVSFAQHRLWFLHQLDPGSAALNMREALRLAGHLDAGALARSFDEICRRHESLRTTFLEIEGQPHQVVAPAAARPLPQVDLSALPAVEKERELERLAQEERNTPFDLTRGPLWRATLIRLSGGEHALLLTLHHIISDGWSMGVLAHELGVLYEAFAAGRPSPLPELALQYAEYTAWQRQWLDSEALQDQLAYWRSRLGGTLPLLDLPMRQRRPAVPSFRGREFVITVPPGLTVSLVDLSRQEGATLFMTLLAAFNALLHCYTGQEDLIVGTDVANRSHQDFEKLIGFFVNNLALRTDLSGAPSFRELLRRVRQEALSSYAHQEVPVDMLIRELQPRRHDSYAPLFQAMFVLQDFPRSDRELPGLVLRPLDFEVRTAPFALSLMMARTTEGLIGSFVYADDLFEDSTIARLAGHFLSLLEQVTKDPDRKVHSLASIHSTESMQMVGAFNDDF